MLGMPFSAPLDRKMRLPDRWGTITRAAAFAQLKWPLRWTAITSSHSCSSMSHRYFERSDAGGAHHGVEPAEGIHGCIDDRTSAVHRRHVDCGRDRLATGGRDLGDHGVGGLGRPGNVAVDRAAVVGDDHPCSGLGRGSCHGAANAAAAAGHDDRLALEMGAHDLRVSRSLLVHVRRTHSDIGLPDWANWAQVGARLPDVTTRPSGALAFIGAGQMGMPRCRHPRSKIEPDEEPGVGP